MGFIRQRRCVGVSLYLSQQIKCVSEIEFLIDLFYSRHKLKHAMNHVARTIVVVSLINPQVQSNRAK